MIDRPSLLQRFLDTGHFPVSLAVVILLLVIACFTLGILKPGDRFQRLLMILAGIAFLANLIMVSANSMLLLEMQARGGVDPHMLLSDHALLETQKYVFNSIALLALVASGILLLVETDETPAAA